MMPIINKQIYCIFATILFFLMPISVLATTNTWQGPYVGAYFGGGIGNNHISSSTGHETVASYFSTPDDINAVNSTATWTKDSNDVIVGIKAGHDWSRKQIIYGIALDYSTLPLSSSKTTNNAYPDNIAQYSVNTSMQTNWLFTLRGRLGYEPMLSLPSLFYLTGGMAITQLKVSNHFNDNSALVGTGGGSTSQNQIGWAGGVGIEIAAFHHLSIDFEYLYIDVPSVKTTNTIYNQAGGFGIPLQSMSSPFSTTANFNANIFKVGLNYRFDE